MDFIHTNVYLTYQSKIITFTYYFNYIYYIYYYYIYYYYIYYFNFGISVAIYRPNLLTYESIKAIDKFLIT